jgi:hypothetical protein
VSYPQGEVACGCWATEEGVDCVQEGADVCAAYGKLSLWLVEIGS